MKREGRDLPDDVAFAVTADNVDNVLLIVSLELGVVCAPSLARHELLLKTTTLASVSEPKEEEHESQRRMAIN